MLAIYWAMLSPFGRLCTLLLHPTLYVMKQFRIVAQRLFLSPYPYPFRSQARRDQLADKEEGGASGRRKQESLEL